MPIILFDILELVSILILLILIGTQIAIPCLFPSVFGPNMFWAFRKKVTQHEMENLRQEMAETEQERQARILRERLERMQVVNDPLQSGGRKTKKKKPVTPKSPPPTESDGEPTSLA